VNATTKAFGAHEAREVQYSLGFVLFVHAALAAFAVKRDI
jgi:hypothetical protein